MDSSDKNSLFWLEDELDQLEASGLRRKRSIREGPISSKMLVDGKTLIHFGSNDYLGLAADLRLREAVHEATLQGGWGSGASPLLAGRARLHDELEQRLAQFEGVESAILFSSGYAANSGTIPALCDSGDTIFSDAKNHASLIEGCRLSRATTHVYPHGDMKALSALLAQYAKPSRRRLIVTDSLFSMDGDLAPLDRIAELADRFDCMVMVDEAHATGVFGKRGRGVSEAMGVTERVDIHMGTLSKALGSAGGFVGGSYKLIEWLTSRARSYVFSTAPPAALCAAALVALDIVEREPHRRGDLLSQANKLRERLISLGWDTGASQSQVIPLRIGEVEKTMALSRALYREGFFVPGIRPPTVPPGESLLRISLGWGHTPDLLDRLVEVLGKKSDWD